MHVRDIIELIIGEEDAPKFAEWAWGENYKNINLQEAIVPLWNERHGNKLTIDSDGNTIQDLKKMIHLWKNET